MLTKALGILILLVVLLLLGTWLIWIPHVRDQGIKIGIGQSTDNLKHYQDSIKTVEAALKEGRDKAILDGLIWHSRSDSLLKLVNAPQDDKSAYHPVPSATAIQRRKRILDGVDQLLR